MLNNFNKIFEQQSEMAKTLASLIPKIDTSMFDAVANIQSSLEALGLTQIQEEQSEMAKTLASLIPKIDTSIFEIFMNIDVLSEKDMENIEILNNKIEKGTNLTREDVIRYFMILWFVISLAKDTYEIYEHIFPDNTEYSKTQAMIQNLETTITKSMNKEIEYEVTKQVHVRALPNSLKESKIIDIAFSKQKLLLISRKPYWIQVEYFNQETVIGWVSKRYTKKLP